MANLFEINRNDNKITLGTTGTTINIASHTASQSLALDAGKNLVSVDLGAVYQPLDAVLTDLAALDVVADNEFIVGTGAGTYAHENAATAATSMGLGTGDSPTFTGLTITGNSVFGLNSSVFQPTTDSITFFQVLDVDGGISVFNVDTTNERVGIGTNAPSLKLDVKGLANTSYTNCPLLMQVHTLDAYAAEMGGGISLGGEYGSVNTTTFGYIAGLKENADEGDYAGKLVFGTRVDGAGGADFTKMTILSSGNVGIGVADPQSKLEVNGNIKGQYITIRTDEINQEVTNNDSAAIFINYSGYLDGTTRYRNLWIGDGKNNLVMIIDGSDHRVGIGVASPHSTLEVNGAISSAQVTCSSSSDAFNVAGVNSVLVDTSGGDVVLGGLAGGVTGQILVITHHTLGNNVTLEASEAEGTQKFMIVDNTDETLSSYGGWTLVCDGTHWYGCNHAKHT